MKSRRILLGALLLSLALIAAARLFVLPSFSAAPAPPNDSPLGADVASGTGPSAAPLRPAAANAPSNSTVAPPPSPSSPGSVVANASADRAGQPSPEGPARPRFIGGPSRVVDGGVRFAISREGIKAAMRGAIPELKDCYEAWLKVKPGLAGKIVPRFTIDTDDGEVGKVTQVSLGDAGLGHAAFEGCVLNVVSDLRFDAPMDGEVQVTYPLVFENRDAGT